jgi:hypothetical protein
MVVCRQLDGGIERLLQLPLGGVHFEKLDERFGAELGFEAALKGVFGLFSVV